MKIVEAPCDIYPHRYDFRVFLAGSIEMGAAENWQEKLIAALPNVRDVTILNPRRKDWDSSWVQDISNPQFKEQVEWELNAISKADLVVFYFDPATKSPISLLELGLKADRWENVIVCCPDGFYRKGNVDVVCEFFRLKQVSSLEELTKAIVERMIAWKDVPF